MAPAKTTRKPTRESHSCDSAPLVWAGAAGRFSLADGVCGAFIASPPAGEHSPKRICLTECVRPRAQQRPKRRRPLQNSVIRSWRRTLRPRAAAKAPKTRTTPQKSGILGGEDHGAPEAGRTPLNAHPKAFGAEYC